MPAPGQTTVDGISTWDGGNGEEEGRVGLLSMWPNSRRAVVNMADSWVQFVTSVLRKTAVALPVCLASYCLRSCWASGRRDRSAMRTEQPFDRRSDAKEQFMPVRCEMTM
jgi:hypothetical protein